MSIIAKLWTKTKVLEHLEEHEEDGQDEEVGYKGAHPPGGGEVGVVHHVDPVLQPNGQLLCSQDKKECDRPFKEVPQRALAVRGEVKDGERDKNSNEKRTTRRWSLSFNNLKLQQTMFDLSIPRTWPAYCAI